MDSPSQHHAQWPDEPPADIRSGRLVGGGAVYVWTKRRMASCCERWLRQWPALRHWRTTDGVKKRSVKAFLAKRRENTGE